MEKKRTKIKTHENEIRQKNRNELDKTITENLYR